MSRREPDTFSKFWPGGGIKARLKSVPDEIGRVLPTSVTIGDANVELYTYQQLMDLSKVNLKQRVLNLREQLGEGRLPPLQAGAAHDIAVPWMIRVEVAAARSVGVEITEEELGLTASKMEPVHQLQPRELARMYAAGVDMDAIPRANLGQRPAVVPSALLAAPRTEPAVEYDWSVHTTVEKRAYSLSPEAYVQAAAESAARSEQ